MTEKTERERDLAFLRDQENWPMWPRLPLKNGYDAAFYLAADADLHKAGGPVRIFRADLSRPFKIIDSECIQFETLDAMLDAGWRID